MAIGVQFGLLLRYGHCIGLESKNRALLSRYFVVRPLRYLVISLSRYFALIVLLNYFIFLPSIKSTSILRHSISVIAPFLLRRWFYTASFYFLPCIDSIAFSDIHFSFNEIPYFPYPVSTIFYISFFDILHEIIFRFSSPLICKVLSTFPPFQYITSAFFPPFPLIFIPKRYSLSLKPTIGA